MHRLSRDARIRSLVQAPDGDRSVHGAYEWKPAWSDRFATANVVPKDDVLRYYTQLMERLRVALGATAETARRPRTGIEIRHPAARIPALAHARAARG